MNRLSGNLSRIISVFVWLIIAVLISFACYVYFSPNPITFTTKTYAKTDLTDMYNVDDKEFDNELLTAQVYTVDKNDLDKYEDLKDYYKGRDNPFEDLNGYREEKNFEIDYSSVEDEEEINDVILE